MLTDKNLLNDPFQQFQRWFEDARRCRAIDQPEAACLSTVNSAGHPTARMILLKDYDRKGFTLFTNFRSPKARALRQHPKASLTFHWGPLRRQVRIEGWATPLDKRLADAYFATRPRLSQISAWASRQSRPLKSRALLVQRFRALQKRFRGREVPAPEYWSGFRIDPVRVEFWQGRPYRLHDRFLYVRTRQNRWSISRLYP